MTVYDRTANGGTVGHPSRMPTPYVITSPVWDTVDGGGVGGDIIELIDVPADTMIISGVLEVLEVSCKILLLLFRQYKPACQDIQ